MRLPKKYPHHQGCGTICERIGRGLFWCVQCYCNAKVIWKRW